jgi:hypothetical protein
MAIKLDPRRLSLLKQLAGESGLRPGELVTHWIEERLDAERSGGQPTRSDAASSSPSAISALSQRLDELARRVDGLTSNGTTAVKQPVEGAEPSAVAPAAPAGRRRPAAPALSSTPAVSGVTAGRRVPLHEEIASVISEGGPMSAGQIAQAIIDRGRYNAPRSDRPLDAATVNSRVSNPTYRSRFRREDGKIGLSEDS